MRYVIYNTTEQHVKSLGGTNTKAGVAIQMVFADLTAEQVDILKSEGLIVHEVRDVSVIHPLAVRQPANPSVVNPSVVNPSVVNPSSSINPIPGVATYSALDLFNYMGLENLRTLTNPPLYGNNMNIAVIDTGIRETHQKVVGHIVYSHNFTTVPMEDTFDNGTGHGTAIAAIIAELAPQAGILNLKVLDGNGQGSDETVALAFDFCISLVYAHSPFAPAVINLSSGGPDLNEPYSVLRVACRQAITAGIIVVAAAGNGDRYGHGVPFTICSPACERYVIAVGSCSTDTREVSSFSSRGPTPEGIIKPDLVLFGENVIVASATGDTNIAAKSGTSFATPLASVIALLAQEGVIRVVQYNGGVPLGVMPQAVSGALNNGSLEDRWIPRVTAKPAGIAADKDNNYGYGLPFGSLINGAVQTTQSGLDISGLIGMMMVVMMMGMMMRSMGNR